MRCPVVPIKVGVDEQLGDGEEGQHAEELDQVGLNTEVALYTRAITQEHVLLQCLPSVDLVVRQFVLPVTTLPLLLLLLLLLIALQFVVVGEKVVLTRLLVRLVFDGLLALRILILA